MTPAGPPPRGIAPAAIHTSWDISSSRFLRGVERTPSFDKDLSRELIARQRGLVRDIKEVIALTRKSSIQPASSSNPSVFSTVFLAPPGNMRASRRTLRRQGDRGSRPHDQ
jgi:hypothetical protein